MSSNGSERYETDPQSFILKIWLEETADEAGKALWRGCITHVPTRTTRYFQEFNELIRFLKSYLGVWGVDFGPGAPEDRNAPP